MLTALSTAVLNNGGELDGDAVVECSGLLTIMKTHKFRFILRTMLKVLSTIEPADKILQLRESGLIHGIPVIRSVYNSLKDYRSDEAFKLVLQESKDLISDSTAHDDDGSGAGDLKGLQLLMMMMAVVQGDLKGLLYQKKRRVTRSTRLADFVVMSSSGNNDRMTLTTSTNTGLNDDFNNFRQMYFEIFDAIITEFESRFFQGDPLIKAIDRVGKFDFDFRSPMM